MINLKVLGFVALLVLATSLVTVSDTGYVLKEGYMAEADVVVPVAPTQPGGYVAGSTIGISKGDYIIVVETYGERGWWPFDVYTGFKVFEVVNGKEKVLANLNQGIQAGNYKIIIVYKEGKIYFSYKKNALDVEPQLIYSFPASGEWKIVANNADVSPPEQIAPGIAPGNVGTGYTATGTSIYILLGMGILSLSIPIILILRRR